MAPLYMQDALKEMIMNYFGVAFLGFMVGMIAGYYIRGGSDSCQQPSQPS